MKKMKTIHRTGTSTCRAEWKSPSGLGLKLRVCSPGVVGALAVTGTRLPTKSCTRLDCSNATSTSLHSYDFVSITCTYISPLNPATRNMPIDREVKPVEEHRAVRTTHSFTNKDAHEPNTPEAQPSSSSRSASTHDLPGDTQSNGTHGKEVNIHACSVTISSGTPVSCQQHTQSLWASLCAGLGPDLHGYTKEELETKTPRHRLRMSMTDFRIAQVQLCFLATALFYMFFILVLAIVSKDRIQVSSSFLWLSIAYESLYIVRLKLQR